jgi:MoxR-like ATPase
MDEIRFESDETSAGPPPEGALASASAPAELASGEGSQVISWADRVVGEVSKVFVGQTKLVRGVLTALLADGHVLFESVPGLGKTLLVRVLGRVLGCSFSRIQFTPDLMPSDVTGSPIYDERISDFRFRPGPVFTQILLADEINRAPAKTHSALLEIMQESRVTIDGVTHAIEPPFLVMATQNPIESEGTYNLPEAQLDRFLLKLVVDYPSAAEEIDILRLHTRSQAPDRDIAAELAVVTGPEEVIDMQRRAREVLVDAHLLGYISSLVRKTREWPTFSLGASPRAGVAILRAARAVAALEGRAYLLPDDIQDVVLPALRHRVMLTPEAEVEGRSADELLTELIRSVEVPLR